MTPHARLKNEFTEDEKYHNLMGWLIYSVCNLLIVVFLLLQHENRTLDMKQKNSLIIRLTYYLNVKPLLFLYDHVSFSY